MNTGFTRYFWQKKKKMLISSLFRHTDTWMTPHQRHKGMLCFCSLHILLLSTGFQCICTERNSFPSVELQNGHVDWKTYDLTSWWAVNGWTIPSNTEEKKWSGSTREVNVYVFWGGCTYICVDGVLSRRGQGQFGGALICVIISAEPPRCRPCHSHPPVCWKARQRRGVWTRVCECMRVSEHLIYSRDISPEVLSVMRLQILTDSTQPS